MPGITTHAAPLAPATPTAVPGNNQATISWSPPASDAPINNYVIYLFIDGSYQSSQTTNSGTATSYTWTGLTNGTTYQFSVIASSCMGYGAYSPRVSATPSGPPLAPGLQPRSPGTSRPASAGPRQIQMGTLRSRRTWSLRICQDRPDPDQHRQRQHRVRRDRPHQRGPVHLRRRGDEQQRPGPVVPASPAAEPNVIPLAPGTPTATAGNTSVVLSWAPPSANGASVDQYSVTPYANGIPQLSHPTGSPSLTYTVTGLTNGTSYTFAVQAQNNMGNGPASAQSSAAIPNVLPGKPGTPTATPANQQVALSWTAPTPNGGRWTSTWSRPTSEELRRPPSTPTRRRPPTR